jgi:hypothetical protein
VDQTGTGDPNPSATIGPDGLPWLLYSKGTGIRVARPSASGSGCTNSAWRCEVIVDVPGEGYGETSDLGASPAGVATAVFSRNIAGFYSFIFANRTAAGSWQRHAVANDLMPLSLDFDLSGRPVVAYQDLNGISLGIARHLGTGAPACGLAANWTCLEIDLGAGLTGYGAALLVDPAGVAHIAYSDADSKALRYAKWVGSGGNCGSGAFFCQSVTNSQTLRKLSIGRNSSGVMIAVEVTGGLALARPAPFGGTGCSFAANWTCVYVSIADTTTGKGERSSMSLDSQGRPHIAYYAQENDSLEIASFDSGSGGGARCSDTSWHCHVLAAPAGYSLSIAIDSAEFLHVAYVNTGGATWSLDYATTLESVPEPGPGASLAGVVAVSAPLIANGLLRMRRKWP